jgi:hypothetical protein
MRGLSFALILLKIVGTTNITLISLTFLDYDSYTGFFHLNPVYDIMIRRIKESDPTVFQNFTHIALRCSNMSFPTAEAGHSKTLTDTASRTLSESDDTLASCFFSFYYRNRKLFGSDLSKQLTIITTPCKLQLNLVKPF